MTDFVLKRMCPSVDELSEVRKNISCIINGCFKILPNKGTLNIHLQKHHKLNIEKKKLDDNGYRIIYRYYCPIDDCKYNAKKLTNGLPSKNSLKQHFLKVHAIRKYICSNCNKGFGCSRLLKQHSNVCGMIFFCSCGNSYASKDALQKHIKKLKNLGYLHSYIKNQVESSPVISKDSVISIPKGNSNVQVSLIFIPNSENKNNSDKSFVPTQLMAANALVELASSKIIMPPADVAVQTLLLDQLDSSEFRVMKIPKYPKGINFKNSCTQSNIKACECWRKKTVGTSKSTQTSFFLNADLELAEFMEAHSNSNDTLTGNCFTEFQPHFPFKKDLTSFYCDSHYDFLVSSSQELSSIQTQTDCDLRELINDFTDKTLFSNSHTQTAFDDIPVIDELLSIQTQTGQDLFPSLFGLSDIQTQTVWTI